MKKILMMLGLVTASAAPLAASAHTDVRIGLNVGVPIVSYRVPAYYDYGTVVERPYCPPRPVVYESYYGQPYYRVNYERPVIVYRDHDSYRDHDEHERHEWREEREHSHWHR